MHFPVAAVTNGIFSRAFVTGVRAFTASGACFGGTAVGGGALFRSSSTVWGAASLLAYALSSLGAMVVVQRFEAAWLSSL